MFAASIALAWLSPGVAPRAFAATESADAKASWDKGKKLAAQKKWDAAVDAFREADVVDPRPQYKLDLARALVESKKLKEASEVLDELDAADDASASIRGAAKKLRQRVDKRLATITVTVTGGGGRAVIQIDGERVKSGQPARVDPGAHQIRAHSDGWVPMEMSLEVGEGKSESVPFKLERDPGFAEPDDETGDEQAPAPAPEGDPGGGTLLPAAVAWGVSAVGFGVGTLFGVFAFDEADKARSNCVENLCTEEAREALEASKLNGGLSTAGFVVGGAGLVTGIVLAVVYGSGDAPAPAAQRGAVRMSPWVGGDQIGVTGAF